MTVLPAPGAVFSQRDEAETRNAISRTFSLFRRKGEDIELTRDRLILHSPDGTRWALSVDNAGVVSASALP